MDRPKWVAGEDYYDAPTCATCHMSASSRPAGVHMTSVPAGWNLRAPISKRTEGWETEAGQRCRTFALACHSHRLSKAFTSS